jgi:5-hydroxyisourate hydrolase
MPGVSIHAVDVSRGIVAEGMHVELYVLGSDEHEWRLVARGRISGKGLLEDPALETRFVPGCLEAVFYVGRFYEATGVSLPSVPFLDVVPYRFGIADSDQHFHLPFKFTPWGYSCFRGGA